MTPGDVLRWNEFSLQRGPGPDKARWFIFLGDTGSLGVPAFLFMLTPTTQLQLFEKGGLRAGRRVVRFEPAPKSPFTAPCLVDVEHDKYELTREYLSECAECIEFMGQVSKEKLLEIWRIIEGSTHYAPKVTKDIKRCLVNAGILRS